MFRKTRIIGVLAVAILMAVCVPLAGADEGDAAPAAAPRHSGYFEQHYILTEIMMQPVFILVFAFFYAIGSQDTTITTRHTDFWNKPTGFSYTKLPIPQEPMELGDFRNVLRILYGVYFLLRVTCLSGILTDFWIGVGRALDATVGH